MTLYYGKQNGVYGFFDSTLDAVPDGSVQITKELHTQLLEAQSKGATLSISNTSVVASDYKGNVIDLSAMKATDNFDQPASLASQASVALAFARTYVYNNYGILNEPTPDNWVTYLKALMAIVNGTDAISTALPMQPTDVMEAATTSSTSPTQPTQ